MRHLRGLTLAELLVCVAIAAALLAAAGPSFSRLVQAARLLDGFHALASALAVARIEAITGGVPVTLCPSRDGLRCRFDQVWEEGWIVYRDPGRDIQPASAEALVLHQPALPAGLVVRGSAGRHRVRYQPSGFAGGSNLSLRVCSGAPRHYAGEVVVSMAGRPRIHRETRPRRPCPFSQ